MIKKETAIEIKSLALKAIESLNTALLLSQEQCSPEDFEKIKKGVGFSVGDIYVELLGFIYDQHPELSNIKD